MMLPVIRDHVPSGFYTPFLIPLQIQTKRGIHRPGERALFDVVELVNSIEQSRTRKIKESTIRLVIAWRIKGDTTYDENTKFFLWFFASATSGKQEASMVAPIIPSH